SHQGAWATAAPRPARAHQSWVGRRGRLADRSIPSRDRTIRCRASQVLGHAARRPHNRTQPRQGPAIHPHQRHAGWRTARACHFYRQSAGISVRTAMESREVTTQPAFEERAQYTLAANPLVGVRGQDILDTARSLPTQMVHNPGVAAQQYLSFLGELGRIATGNSGLAPDAKDKRFSDQAWRDSSTYRALAQCYLAWGEALNRFVSEARMDRRTAERARFVVSLFVDAMSPTNSLAGNPAALKKLIDTGGASLVHGLENFVGDFVRNGGLPAQVDMRQFAVGKNLATTAGSVVYRDPVMELIQYQPLTDDLHPRPLLIAPPQINKFYVFDLAPEKSIVQMALKGGLQTFAISWKNPTSAQGHFGLDTYVTALDKAVDVMRDITGSPDVNIWGSC